MVDLDADIEKLAEAAVADWPEIAFSGQFDAAIRSLYRSRLQFPPSWSQDERDDFIESNADMDASRLTEKFDDLIDTVINHFVHQDGALPHNDDAANRIDAERHAAIYELGFNLTALSDEIAEVTSRADGT